MAKNSFVSISFSNNKLQVLKLGSSKKKVTGFMSVDIPPELIVSNKVQNVDALAVLIKNVWKKLGFREKSVGLTVPEFSTFIKNLKLPVLDSSELDEAIRWQAQDFLPKPTKDMVLDWKIVMEGESDFQVLTMAIDDEILSGYVQAVDRAGLFPLVVETPSLSLVRLTSKVKVGKLIIYANENETVLTVARDGDVLGSSVINKFSEAEIIRTSQNIIGYYKDTKVEQVFVCGTLGTEELGRKIQDTLNIPTSPLSYPIAGLSAQDIQNLLIPISLQFKELSEPSDEHTINLLPGEVVKKYQSKKTRFQILSLMMIFTFFVWSSFVAVAGSYVYLTQQLSNVKTQNAPILNIASQNEDARAQIKAINTISDNVIKIDKASFSAESVLNDIFNAKNEGVALTSYSLDLDTGLIAITGVSATRNDLLLFKQSLEQNENFDQVILPFTSFEAENNSNFNLTFKYKPVLNINKNSKISK